MNIKSRLYYYRITHNTTLDASSKSDMFSSLMHSNLGNLSMNQNNASSAAAATVAPAAPQLALPYNASSNNAPSWHSANPLVMNHQLASPQASSNNNFSSLDDLDPFGSGNQVVKPNNANGANMYTLQQPTVNYIYPTGYNTANNSMNSMQQSLALNKPMNLGGAVPTLMPQASLTSQSADSKNLNTLSQQDILNFLN